MYFALIGDIIHSKELKKEERNEVQEKLKKLLEWINKEYGKDIAANFLITIGDEFQGLFHSPGNLINIIDAIQFKLFPVKIRFGVGLGEIDTQINKEMALGADGPAYHNARKSIDAVRLSEKGKQSGSTNILFHTDKEEQRQLIDLINSNLQLCSFIDSKWTDKQRQLIQSMFLGKKNQTEAAAELNIAQSSVQRRLKSAGYYDYLSARDVITDTLNHIKKGEA